ncbi:MAG: glycosyltransferase family 39 protein [Alphaproteobacteria bacterium]|nr:glycosyltransferase family 39 protein [Alphaproteobacteria bacterium]
MFTLLVFAALPLLSVWGMPGSFIAHPLGELPIKIFVFDVFNPLTHPERFLGGTLDMISYPNVGTLNNPDPVGSLVVNLLRPLMGLPNAYNLFVCGQLYAAMCATWLLARDLIRDERAALTAAVAFTFTPLILVYPVMGAITDVLNFWPYPLAILYTLRALRQEGWRNGLLGGLFAGLGVVTCPYNFVVFAAAVVPAVLWLPLGWRDGLVPVEDPEALDLSDRRAVARQWLRAAVGVVVPLLVIGGAYALQLRHIMDDPTSMIGADAVDVTRHRPPYPYMWPPATDRYMAYLSDYVAVGKDAMIVRDLGARLFRAFSPGFLVMGLGVLGLVKAPRRRGAALWLLIAAFFVIASTGPFLPLDGTRFFAQPVNVIWLALHHGFPGADMLLEGFRYTFAAALGFAVAASLGARWLIQRFGGWVGLALPALITLEVVFVSPVPAPLPTFRPFAPALYSHLDELAGPGAIIELPYTIEGTALFDRMHFYHQTLHGRPIANEVQGFLPRYLATNEFTNRLLSIENQNTAVSLPYVNRQRYKIDQQALIDDGFAAIIVNPAHFRNDGVEQQILERLEEVGLPVAREGRLVFVLRKPAP